MHILTDEENNLRFDQTSLYGEYKESCDTVAFQPYFHTGISVDRDNPIVEELVTEIENSSTKQIPYSRFVQHSLYHDTLGYYTSGNVCIGVTEENTQAHFLTAPEASEYFGAAYAHVLFQTWEKLGMPEKFDVVEMGAGSGALAEGVLKEAFELNSSFFNAIVYKIIEYSPSLISSQQKKLQHFIQKMRWIEGSAYEITHEEIEGGFIFNELVDAFPFERVVKVQGKLYQKYITVQDNEWVEVLGELSDEVKTYIAELDANHARFEVHEGCEEPVFTTMPTFQKSIQKALKRGVVINSDYGREGAVGGDGKRVVRAYGNRASVKQYQGNFHDAVAYHSPGSVDLTASVNFNPILALAKSEDLEIVFSGLQKDFIVGSGVHSKLFAALNSRNLRRERGWGKTAEQLDKMLDYWKTVSKYATGKFHTIVLSKGIAPLVLDQPPAESLNHFNYWFPQQVHIGLQNTFCKAYYGDGSYVRELATDAHGFLDVIIRALDLVTVHVYQGADMILLDFKNDEALRDRAVSGDPLFK